MNKLPVVFVIHSPIPRAPSEHATVGDVELLSSGPLLNSSLVVLLFICTCNCNSTTASGCRRNPHVALFVSPLFCNGSTSRGDIIHSDNGKEGLKNREIPTAVQILPLCNGRPGFGIQRVTTSLMNVKRDG